MYIHIWEILVFKHSGYSLLSSNLGLIVVDSNGEIRIKKLGLSRKQYYSRMAAMMATGLIKRQRGIYYLTPFGKVIYCCIMIVKSALKNYYNLKAVEYTEASGFSNEDFSKLVDTLIDNRQVKEFLAKKC